MTSLRSGSESGLNTHCDDPALLGTAGSNIKRNLDVKVEFREELRLEGATQMNKQSKHKRLI